MEQSWPVQLGSQLHVPVSARNAPCPEHWSMQDALGLSHPGPPHPTKQWHSPWTHTPRPEHVGSRQSTRRGFAKTTVSRHSSHPPLPSLKGKVAYLSMTGMMTGRGRDCENVQRELVKKSHEQAHFLQHSRQDLQ